MQFPNTHYGVRPPVPLRWVNLQRAGIGTITRKSWYGNSLRNAPYIIATFQYRNIMNGIIKMEFLTKRGTTFTRRFDVIHQRMTR